MSAVAAAVGDRVVTVAEVDERERAVRDREPAHALPAPGTSEARQLRRWLAQVLVAEQVVALEPLDHPDAPVPSQAELLPDTVARLELGSVAAATLATDRGRAVFARVTAAVRVPDDEVTAYCARNPGRFVEPVVVQGVWRRRSESAPDPSAVAAHLLDAARRRSYRRWLDARCAALVTLAPGWEHPGDPRQPDNTHRH